MSFLITSYKSVVLLKTATSEKENKDIDVKDTHNSKVCTHWMVLYSFVLLETVSFTKNREKKVWKTKLKERKKERESALWKISTANIREIVAKVQNVVKA